MPKAPSLAGKGCQHLCLFTPLPPSPALWMAVLFQPSAQLSGPSQEYRGSALVAIETTLASSLLAVFLNSLHHSLLSWGQKDHFFN